MLLPAEKTINKTKRQLMNWEKVFANHVTDKGLIFRIYKHHTAQYKTNKPIKNEQED